MRLASLVLALGAGLVTPAGATTTVYRCGPHGNEYSASPCTGGRAVAVDDRRDAGQRAQARDVAARDQALAGRMAAERRAADAAALRQHAVGILDSRAAQRRDADQQARADARRATPGDPHHHGKGGKPRKPAKSGSLREVRLPTVKPGKPAPAKGV